MCQVQQEASSERRSQGPYISLTPAQSLLLESMAENSVTTMMHYYSKAFPDMAWLRAPKFYLLGVVSSYPLRLTALLICQYFTFQ